MSKSVDENYDTLYHPTLNDYLEEIQELMKTASKEDKEILSELQEFYLSSDLVKCAKSDFLSSEYKV